MIYAALAFKAPLCPDTYITLSCSSLAAVVSNPTGNWEWECEPGPGHESLDRIPKGRGQDWLGMCASSSTPVITRLLIIAQDTDKGQPALRASQHHSPIAGCSSRWEFWHRALLFCCQGECWKLGSVAFLNSGGFSPIINSQLKNLRRCFIFLSGGQRKIGLICVLLVCSQPTQEMRLGKAWKT